MAEYAIRLANGQDTAARMRRADMMALAPDGTGLARQGFRVDGGGSVTVNSGTMSVLVQPFMAWIDGTVSNAQGGYPFVLDAAKSLTVSPGHATLARVDTVVAAVRDTAFDGSGFTDARVYIVEGAPGGGAPAVPANAIPLRNINVPAGASTGTGGLTAANLGTDRRVYTVAAGGIIPVASQAERDAIAVQPGTTVYRKDTDVIEVWSGSAWKVHTRAADPVWSTYVPAWTASTTNPTVGNGTISGRYVVSGGLVNFRAKLTLGTTSNVGAGAYALSLPVPASSADAALQFLLGEATIGGGAFRVVGRIGSGGTTALLYCDPTTAGASLRAVTPTTPGTFSNGQSITLTGSYEPAP